MSDVSSRQPCGNSWVAVHASVALISFGVYLATMAPGLGGSGDNMKFQFVGAVWGTAHATGYPGYTMMLGAFQALFPAGSLAWRANLFSVVTAVAAIQLLIAMLRELEVGLFATSAAALTLGASVAFWSEATVSEVYPLHAAFTCASLWSLVRFGKKPTRRRLLVACTVLAFSFGNHMTSVLMVPTFVAFVALTGLKTVLRFGTIARMILIVCLAATQYMYLFYATTSDTPYLESEVKTIHELWYVASGAQFSGRFLRTDPGFLTSRLPMAARLMVRDVGWLIPAALFGLYAAASRVRLLVLGFLLANALFAVGYDIPDIDSYFIPVEICFVVLGAIGLSRFWLARGRVCCLCLGFFLVSIPLGVGAFRFASMDRSHAVERQEEAQALIYAAGPHSALLSPDFETSESLWYYTLGEKLGVRMDINVVHHVSPVEVAAYLRGESSIYLPEERRMLSPGLRLYSIGSQWDESFSELDVSSKPVAGSRLRLLQWTGGEIR